MRYRYCGLVLDSSLALPELPVAPVDAPVDVAIRVAAVPAGLSGETLRAPLFELDDDSALWCLEGVARYRIHRAGRRIDVAAAPFADPAAVRLMLLHPVFVLAGVLRGEFLLRAAAVRISGEVVAFAGPSAIGKSTVAALLAARGHEIVADDVLRVTLGDDGTALAHPQAPWLLLWPDALEHVGLGATVNPARRGVGLQRVDLPAVAGPCRLSRLVVLAAREAGGAGVSGAEGFDLIRAHSAGRRWVDRSGPTRVRHFAWCAAVARALTFGDLETARDWNRFEAFVAHLERAIEA